MEEGWEIQRYREFTKKLSERPRILYSGQVIRLKHAESGGFICIDDECKVPLTTEPQGYLRIYTGSSNRDNDDEAMTSNQLFQVELVGESEHGQAMVWTDQTTQKQPQYRFRHLNSGRVLCVKSISKDGKNVVVLTTSQTLIQYVPRDPDSSVRENARDETKKPKFNRVMDFEGLDSIFSLKSSTIDLDNFISNESVVKIRSAVNGFYLTSVKQASSVENEEGDDDNDSVDSAAEDLALLH